MSTHPLFLVPSPPISKYPASLTPGGVFFFPCAVPLLATAIRLGRRVLCSPGWLRFFSVVPPRPLTLALPTATMTFFTLLKGAHP